jgi:spermidine synthase
VKPWKTLARSHGPGTEPLVLQERDGEFVIRAGGHVLMSSARRDSEEALAEAGLAGLGTDKPNVLIGGLGLGFTLRAALDRVSSAASVVVAEISPAVVEWNRGPLAYLAGAPLEDPRVTVRVEDVGRVAISGGGPFDAILLDVDNGPAGLAREANDALYGQAGLQAFFRALSPRGRLVVWSAGPDAGFLERMRKVGFEATQREVAARLGSRSRHFLFLGTRR